MAAVLAAGSVPDSHAGLKEQATGDDFNQVTYYKSVKEGSWKKSLYEGKEFERSGLTTQEFKLKNNTDFNSRILPMEKSEAFNKVFDNSKRASGFDRPFQGSDKKFAGFDARSGFDGKKADWSKQEARLGGEDVEIAMARESDDRYVENKMYKDNRKMYDAPELKKIRQDVDIISEAAKKGVELKDGRLSVSQIKEILNKN